MVDVTFLKNDGLFVVNDYVGGTKAAQRLSELANDVVQAITQTYGMPIEGVLVSKAWLDAKMAVFAGTPIPSMKHALIIDDEFGYNLTKHLDLLNGRSQTLAGIPDLNNKGTTNQAFLMFAVVDSAQFIVDDRELPITDDGARIGGNVKGYLMHKDVYNYLNTVVPVGTVYVGTGDGFIPYFFVKDGCVAETVTITLADAANFAVVGSVTGPMGSGVVGTEFNHPYFKFLMVDGVVPFVAADAFTVTVAAL